MSETEQEVVDIQLKQWLEKVHCQQYYENFAENNISLDLLSELDTEALKEIGVNRVGDRLRIEMEISRAKVPKFVEGPLVKSLLENLRLQITSAVASAKNAPAPQLPSPGSEFGVLSPSNGLDIKSKLVDNNAGQKETTKYVSFILSDGSIKRINVIGCFNGPSIKRKVMRKLGLKQSEEVSFDTYTYTPTSTNGEELANPARFEMRPDGTNAGISILSDVELVTVCYTPERLEKHRIILCAKNQRPSRAAIETSIRMMIKHGEIITQARGASSSAARTERMRDFFGQRPPSELISSNLAEYFPHTQQKQLEATVRNSVRFSVRVPRNPHLSVSNHDSSVDPHASGRASMRGSPPLMGPIGDRHFHNLGRRTLGRTIGDVMISNVAAIDEAMASSDVSSDTRSMHTSVSRLSRPALLIASSGHDISGGSDKGNHRYSRIELLSVDTDSEEEKDKSVDADKSVDSKEEDDNNDALPGNEFASLGDLFDSETPINWLKGSRIGAGTFGVVYLGMNPTTGELMAVKQILLPTENSTLEMQQLVLDQQREMHLLKELNHENIVRYLGATTSDGYFNIFLEYVPGGSVLSMLTSYGPFEEPLVRNFVQQVLIGLSYLHGENIIHRDIKGANILIDIKGTVKIGDFGISKRVNAGDEEEEEEKDQLNQPRRRASLQGLVFWMAPEVVKQVAYTKKADIWLVGALIIEMFTGTHPFPLLNHMQAIFKLGTLVSPEIPDWCTAEATDFLSKTFEINYEKRPDAVTLLSDQFLNPLLLARPDRGNAAAD